MLKSPIPIRRPLRRALRRLKLGSSATRHALVGRPEVWQLKRDFQIAFLRAQGLASDDRFLDIGCGTLRGGIPVIEHLHAGRYTGLEVRAEVIAEAWRELEAAGLEHKGPRLIQNSDFDALEIDHQVDVAWAFSVLFHMTDEIAESAISFVGRHLAPQGRCFANVCLGEAPDGSWQGFPVVTRPLRFYEQLAETAGLTVTPLGRLDELGHPAHLPDAGQVMLAMTRTGRQPH
jgi:SAM-dependent methyltransferase